ncbi:hypothetical protein AUC70_14815 [Methyloceanibacter stevinii]|uniref:AsmA domain-containing protein n=1 Tax=Methyloceanibacter stevinii TaxID=1774970 RepID=A0A1E3VSQ8_9HYPH|nr:hypothetical protein [Methyloceanibacter stevinii]ODR96545.1 hypothetical protein AUC70_14815 [Methyloceanibacter stevinii]
MSLQSFLRTILQVGFILLLILAVPLAGLLLISAGPFEEVRRKAAEYFISEAIEVPVEVKGPVEIGFSLEPKVSLQDIVAVESRLPSDMKDLSVKAVDVEIPLLPLLTGRLDLSGLTVDGLKVAIDMPQGAVPKCKASKRLLSSSETSCTRAPPAISSCTTPRSISPIRKPDLRSTTPSMRW